MRIIPVLDLKQGLVVQGIRGERDLYRPVRSVLTSSSQPPDVARALQRETHCAAFYIADLDAIQGTGDQLGVVRQLAAELDADLWVDAGIADPASVQRLLDAGAGRAIIGSETLAGLDRLAALCQAQPPERLLFSLDVKGGRLLAADPQLAELEPLQVLAYLAQWGWSDAILLTLDRVGTGAGPDRALLAAARREAPGLALIVGGGVRTPDELRELATAGASGVLLASALHQGWIRGADLVEFTNVGGGPENSQDHCLPLEM
jgi:phosphoribosylformimino-5-aminoimidazole carboxamide ribotide isomerase